MMDLLIGQSLCFSVLASLLMLAHQANLKYLGIHYTYAIWSGLPLLLLTAFITPSLTQWLSPFQLELMSRYQVTYQGVIVSAPSLATLSLLTIWCVGVTLMLSILLLHALYLQKLKSESTLCQLYQIESSGLAIYQHPKLNSPMLMGLFRPCILVPTQFHSLEPAQRHGILAHEQRHYQRADLIANLIAWCLLSLFWFNPIAWLAYRRFRDDQELACDAEVCQILSTSEKIAYSQALLAYSQHRQVGMLSTHYGNKSTLKERIMQLKKPMQHGKSKPIMLVLIVGLAAGGLLLNQQVVAGNAHQEDIHPISRVEPIYPAEAVSSKQNGFVVLRFDISPAGEVSNTEVIKSSPIGLFDTAASDALSQWRYSASANGQKQAMVQLDFVIESDESVKELERIRVTH